MVKSKFEALLLVCLTALLLTEPDTSLAATTAVSPESIEPAGGKSTLEQELDEGTNGTKLPSEEALTATDKAGEDGLATDRYPNTEIFSPETIGEFRSTTEWEMG